MTPSGPLAAGRAPRPVVAPGPPLCFLAGGGTMDQSSAAARGPAERRGPGKGEKRRPRGRLVEPAALAEVQALLGERPRRRDLLIEHLHLVQDRFGQISAAHL